MRRLLLMRHAKAERSLPGGRDRDRVLAERGRDDAPKVGRYLVRHNFVPDLALVSDSARTRETWALLAKAFETVPPARFEERIYESSTEAILQAIKDTPPGVKSLLVLGHNPGLQELAVTLAASGDVEARQRLKEEFPTSALAVIVFAQEDWSALHARGGRLDHLVTPRTLAEATD
jgi:phosphohistidine phosphatase